MIVIFSVTIFGIGADIGIGNISPVFTWYWLNTKIPSFAHTYCSLQNTKTM